MVRSLSTSSIQLHNVPTYPTPFVNRDRDIRNILTCLQDVHCRLLTLIGAGGMGKTRLAIESVSHLDHDNFEHGVYFVPLAPLTTADNIGNAIINALGIMIGNDDSPRAELTKFLSRRNLLLVLDNFEHVMAGAELVSDILTHAPEVKILVTSREVLNLRTESIQRVNGLNYPHDTTMDIDAYNALQLFIECAHRVRQDFSVIDHLEQIIRICELVDGMPLGIELAASWLRSLSSDNIIKHIESGIDFLTHRAQDVPARHRSIRAVFAHSWELLSADEKTVFAYLSVFRGGFTVDSAGAVTGIDVYVLTGLVEKSMLRPQSDGRYDIHELLRQYAHEKLVDMNRLGDVLSAHADYFSAFMAEHAIDIKGRRQIDALNEIEADWDNILDVWNRAIENHDNVALGNMMEATHLFVDIRARYIEGATLFKQAVDVLQLKPADDIMYSQLCIRYVHVWSLTIIRPIPDHIWDMLGRSLDVARTNHDKLTEMLGLWVKAELYRHISEIGKCNDTSIQARHLAQTLQATYYEVRILRVVDYFSSRIARDESVIDPAVRSDHQRLSQRIQDHNGYAHARFFQGYLNFVKGNEHIARTALADAMENWELVKDTRNVALTILSLGVLDTVLGNFDVAYNHMMTAERMLTQLNFWNNHYSIYVYASWGGVIENRLEDAVPLIEKAQHLHDEGLTSRRHEIYFVRVLYAITTDNHEEVMTQFMETVKSFKPPYSADMWVMLVAVTPFILYLRDEYEQSALFLGATSGAHAHLMRWMNKWDKVTELRDNLRRELGDNRYESLIEQGATSDIRQMIKQLQGYLVQFQTNPAPTPAPAQSLIEPLTKREIEILPYLVAGMSNLEIGETLYIAEGTVKRHVYNICRKLDVKNRTQVVIRAKELKLID